MRRQALMYFAMQREERGREWAERFRNDGDLDMRAAALYLAASLGDATALEPITTLLREQPRASIRYGLLLALAELVDPAEFVRRVGPARQHGDEYDGALRIAKLRSARAKERVALARKMLESQFPNERRIAMRALLERNALNELTSLLEQWWRVPAHMRATVAAELYRGGYRLVEKNRRLEIERRQSSILRRIQSSSASTLSEILDGTMSLVDRRVDRGLSPRVGVGHGNPPEACPADHVRELVRSIHEVEQRVVGVGVSVSPAVDRNGLDVSCRIEAAARKRPGELSTNLTLDLGEWRPQHPIALGPELLARRQRRVGDLPESLHVDDDRILRTSGKLVATKAHGKVEHGVGVVAAGSRHGRDSDLLPGLPISQEYGRIENWDLHGQRERLALAIGQLRTQVGDHCVVAGEHAGTCPDAIGTTTTDVGDRHAITVLASRILTRELDSSSRE